MSLGRSLIQMLIMSFTLAVWELLGKPLFFQFAEGEGIVGVGPLTVAYFVVLMIGWVIGKIVTRPKHQDE